MACGMNSTGSKVKSSGGVCGTGERISMFTRVQ